MSGGGFELDPDLLVRTAEQVDTVRTRLVAATAALLDGFDGDGNPWGADQQGSAFGAVFDDVLRHAVSVMGTHADQLDYASRSLRVSAQDHVANDEDVRARFDALGDGL